MLTLALLLFAGPVPCDAQANAPARPAAAVPCPKGCCKSGCTCFGGGYYCTLPGQTCPVTFPLKGGRTVRWQFWDAQGRTWFADVAEPPTLPPPPPQFRDLGLPGGPVQVPPPARMPPPVQWPALPYTPFVVGGS